MPLKINIFAKNKIPWYDRAIVYCLYAAIIAIPVIFLPLFYTVFSLPKLFVLRAVTIAIALLWAYKIYLEKKVSWRQSRFPSGLFLYALASIASAAFSISPMTSFLGQEGGFVGLITTFDLLFLAFASYHWLRDRESAWKVITVSSITSAVLAVYGILQFFGIFQEAFNWSEDPSTRVFGTIGHANHFGAYLAMNIILTVFLFERFKAKKIRLAVGAAVVFQCITLALTGSRGAVLALMIGFISVLAVLFRNNYQRSREIAKKYMALIIVTLTLCAAVMVLGLFRIVKFELADRVVNNIVFMQEGHLPDRVSWWLSSLDMVSDRPLLGFGLATFRDAFNQYRRRDFATQAPGEMQDLITPEAAHNEYLNTAVTQGILGLFLFLAMIYLAFRPLPGRRKTDIKNNLSSLAFRGAIIVYLVQVFFNFGVIATLGLFYILLGSLAAANSEEVKAAEYKLPLYSRLPLITLIIAAVCLCGFLTYRQAAAEFYYKQAVIGDAEKNYNQAIIAFQSAINEMPLEYIYPQEFADFALKSSMDRQLEAETRLKFLNLAQNKYSQALALNNHHPSTHFNLGISRMQIYLITKNNSYLEQSLESFGRAEELAVNNPLYPYQIGLSLTSCQETRCREAAKKAFSKALEIRPGFRDAGARLKQLP